MSNSHKASKILLSKNTIPIDGNTTFLAHYDITENDVLRGIEPISNITTLRPIEGYFGGGIAIEEGTINTFGTSYTAYNNYSVPVTKTLLSETLFGQPIYRFGFTVDDAHSANLSHFQTSLSSHGVYGGSQNWVQDTSYCSSIYWRPVNKMDMVFGGTASNTAGWSSGGNQTSPNGEWKRFYRYRTGVGVATKSDTVHHSFYCPSLQLNETIYFDVSCGQTEEGKRFPTSYTNGTRGSGLLTYPQEIFNPNEGTFYCWAKTEMSSIEKNIFFQWDTTGSANSHFGLVMGTNGKITFLFGNQNITSTNSYNDGNWHCYAVTWKNGSGNTKLYVDGVLVATSSGIATLQNIGGRKNGVVPIGHRGWTYNDYWWNGIIDELRIDKVERSEKEIASWYISQLPFYPKGIYRLAY